MENQSKPKHGKRKSPAKIKRDQERWFQFKKKKELEKLKRFFEDDCAVVDPGTMYQLLRECPDDEILKFDDNFLAAFSMGYILSEKILKS